MLTIVTSKDSSGAAIDYYTRSLIRDDYFFSGRSIHGRFHGNLAKILGCAEKVSKRAFSRLVQNRHPVTNKPFSKRKLNERRSYYDFTFSAVKSASIALGVLGDKDILRVHRRAVKVAMRELEMGVMTKTRTNGRQHYVRTGKPGLFRVCTLHCQTCKR